MLQKLLSNVNNYVATTYNALTTEYNPLTDERAQEASLFLLQLKAKSSFEMYNSLPSSQIKLFGHFQTPMEILELASKDKEYSRKFDMIKEQISAGYRSYLSNSTIQT